MMQVPCRVCHRPLRSLISRQEGIGPACRKKVRAMRHEIFGAMERAMREERNPNSDVSRILGFEIAMEGMTERELRTLMEQNARNQYLASFPRRRRTEGRSFQPFAMVELVGRYENGVMLGEERVEVRFLNEHGSAMVVSGDHNYSTTSNACTCPDFIYRRRGLGQMCRHMLAAHNARQRAVESGRVVRWTELPAPVTTDEEIDRQIQNPIPERSARNRAIPAKNAIEQAVSARNHDLRTANWQKEESRLEAIAEYNKINHSNDIDYSDPKKFNSLLNSAKKGFNKPYDAQPKLGGANNTFGIEYEMGFSTEANMKACLEELKREGILASTTIESPWEPQPKRKGFWTAKTDCSLEGRFTVEIVTDVLDDSEASWEKSRKATEIFKKHGGFTNSSCGTHIHVGYQIIADDIHAIENLSRIGIDFEGTLFRMAGANYDDYIENQTRGSFRNSMYVKPLGESKSLSSSFESLKVEAEKDRDQDIAKTMIRRLNDNGTRSMFMNLTNIYTADSSRKKPTVEFRQANGTLNPQQIQDMTVVYNAMIFAAATMKNDAKRQKNLSKLTDTYPQYRFNRNNGDRFMDREQMERVEEANFKRFLTILPPYAHEAATRLWVSGRSNFNKEG